MSQVNVLSIDIAQPTELSNVNSGSSLGAHNGESAKFAEYIQQHQSDKGGKTGRSSGNAESENSVSVRNKETNEGKETASAKENSEAQERLDKHDNKVAQEKPASSENEKTATSDATSEKSDDTGHLVDTCEYKQNSDSDNAGQTQQMPAQLLSMLQASEKVLTAQEDGELTIESLDFDENILLNGDKTVAKKELSFDEKLQQLLSKQTKETTNLDKVSASAVDATSEGDIDVSVELAKKMATLAENGQGKTEANKQTKMTAEQLAEQNANKIQKSQELQQGKVNENAESFIDEQSVELTKTATTDQPIDKVKLTGLQNGDESKPLTLKSELKTAINDKEAVLAEKQVLAEQANASVVNNEEAKLVDAGVIAQAAKQGKENSGQNKAEMVSAAKVAETKSEFAAVNKQFSQGEQNDGQKNASYFAQANVEQTNVEKTTTEQTNEQEATSSVKDLAASKVAVAQELKIDIKEQSTVESKAIKTPETLVPHTNVHSASYIDAQTQAAINALEKTTIESATNIANKQGVNIHNETIAIYRKDFSQAVKDKVMVMINNKLRQLEIRLDPPELGSMHVKVNMQNEQAMVSFVVQNQQAKDALEQNMGKLRDMLSEQGVDVGDANVEQQQQQANAQDESEQGNSRFLGGDLEEAEQQQGMLAQQNLYKASSTGVDYFV